MASQRRTLALALSGLLVPGLALVTDSPRLPIWTRGDGYHRVVRVQGTKSPPGRLSQGAISYISVLPDGTDLWRASEIRDILNAGGCGVIPTDTSYSFVTLQSNKDGIERILRMKGATTEKKTMSLLCKDITTVTVFTKGVDKDMFKVLKKNLPGPYTFILPASEQLPKMIYKEGKKKWKRKEIGIRIPDDPVCQALLEDLDEPLLASTVPTEPTEGGKKQKSRTPTVSSPAAIGDAWCKQVDFVLDAGERPGDGSTIFDFTIVGEPVLVREGLGSLELRR